MFCPKCGNVCEENAKVCSKCEFDFQSVGNVEGKVIENKENVGGTIKRKSLSSKYIFFILSIIVLIMFWVAADNISEGGYNIMRIESVGGKTLEEAYYAEVGTIYSGYAIISRALGIFFASVLVWLGLKK